MRMQPVVAMASWWGLFPYANKASALAPRLFGIGGRGSWGERDEPERDMGNGWVNWDLC